MEIKHEIIKLIKQVDDKDARTLVFLLEFLKKRTEPNHRKI